MSPQRHSAGFTLIELLIAITLASLVAVLGAVVLRAALDFHGRAVRELKESEDLHAADRLLSREWSGRRAQNVVANSTWLEFQTDQLYGAYNAGGQGALRIGYFCTENAAGEVVLERRLLARADPDQPPGGSAPGTPSTPSTPSTPRGVGGVGGAGGTAGTDAMSAGWRVLRTEVLMPQLVACSFGYLQTRQDRDARIAEWQGEVGAGQPVPRLVRLRLVTERGEIAPLVYGADN